MGHVKELFIAVVGRRRCVRGGIWGSGTGGVVEVPLGDSHYDAWKDGGGVGVIVSVVD